MPRRTSGLAFGRAAWAFALALALGAPTAVHAAVAPYKGEGTVAVGSDGNASLGVCWDHVDFEGLAHRPYRRDRLALAVYAGHALAGRASIGFEETLAFDHVGLPPSSAVHTMLQRAAASAGRTVTYRVVVSGFDAALRVVAANLGVSVVPLEVGRRGAAGADVELIPIDDAWAERSFAICFRELESLPPASQRLVEYLQRRAADAEATT